MAGPSHSSEWTRRLPEESADWVRKGIVSEEQRQSILALYPEDEASRRDRTVLIFTILGSLLVGVGVILFFAANWPNIPAWFKVGAIVVAVVGAYWGGYYLQYVRGDYPRLGHSLIFLGGLLYGAGIWLIGQIFHLNFHYPTAFLLWGAGLLPMIWAVSSRPLLYLATGLLWIWTFREQAEFQQFNYLFPILMLGVVMPLARLRTKSVLVEAGVLVGLLFWFVIDLMLGVEGQTDVFAGAMIGRTALLYGAVVLLMGFARLGDERVYLGIGSLASLFGLYLMTFEWHGWRTSSSLFAPGIFEGPLFQQVGMGILLAAVAVCAWLYWKQGHRLRPVILTAVLLLVPIAFSVSFLDQVSRMIVFNLLLFAGTLALIVLALRRQSQLLLNLGLGAFVVHVLTRYFDLFFSALNKSLFFILGGVLLLGGGWLLERNRRRWTQEWEGDGK